MALTGKSQELDFKVLFNCSPDAICIHDFQGRIIEVNEAFSDRYGYSRSEILDLTVKDFDTPEQAQFVAARIHDLLQNGHITFETIHQCKDGACLSAEVSSHLIQYNCQNAALSIVRDITERKRVEKELRASGLLFQRTIDGLPDWLHVVDKDLRFVYVNETFHKFFTEITKEDNLIGKFFADIQSYLPKEIIAEYYQVLDSGQPLRTLENTEISGRNFSTETHKYPIFNNGRITHIVTVMRDVTERKLAAADLLKAKDAAEAASRAKSFFLANMSHEVRTPMTAIIGYTELVLNSALSPEQRQYLEFVRFRSNDLLLLINDILDMSKIDAGRLTLKPARFSLAQALKEITHMFSLTAEKKGLRLSMELAPDVPTSVCGDLQRLRQVLVNLIGNAVKFTDNGEVSVRVSLEKEGEEGVDGGRLKVEAGNPELGNEKQSPKVSSLQSPGSNPQSAIRNPKSLYLHFQVKDTGIGIPQDQQELIFEPFGQGNHNVTHKHGGTGLGLSIARRLVTAMGGRIWVESKPGRGSIFHFNILLDTVDDMCLSGKKTLVAQAVVLRTLRVLVAEDDEMIRRLVIAILEKNGHVVSAVCDGREVLKQLSQADFDLLLMDVQMPGMGGLEAAKTIRDQMSDVRDHAIPIIAMTGFAMSEDEAICLESGMNAYVPKPISPRKLLAVIEGVINAPKC